MQDSASTKIASPEVDKPALGHTHAELTMHGGLLGPGIAYVE